MYALKKIKTVASQGLRLEARCAAVKVSGRAAWDATAPGRKGQRLLPHRLPLGVRRPGPGSFQRWGC